jgi:GTPase SAR1 family protein
MFDVCDRGSFDAVPRWFADYEKYTSETSRAVLVGCKIDKQNGGPYVNASRDVGAEEAHALAGQYGMVYLECSAKSGGGIRQVVSSAVVAIRKAQGSLADHARQQQQRQQKHEQLRQQHLSLMQRLNRYQCNCMQHARAFWLFCGSWRRRIMCAFSYPPGRLLGRGAPPGVPAC